MIILYSLYSTIIVDIFTFKDYVRILQYIQPLLRAEANINKYSHAYFLKLDIPFHLMEKVMDYNDLPQSKKLKGVLNFSESQTLITQRYYFIVKPYAKQLSSSEKNKIDQHLRYSRQKIT